MKFNDQKQFIVDRFTKELEDAGLGAYRIEVVRDTNYCFRLASTCYINMAYSGVKIALSFRTPITRCLR